jgi:hypothetical protein
MTDFRMPDSWYDPPDDPCEECDGEGCRMCVAELAYEWAMSTDPRV